METLITHKFQEDCAILAALKKGFGVFAEPGLGKTVIALRLAQIINAERVLVIAPKLVAWNSWPSELEKWDLFSDLSYTIIHDEKPFNKMARIWIVNPEGLKKEIIRKTKFDLLILDESTLFKSRQSLRFKRVMKLAKRIPYRLILTGCPIPRDYQDLYSQIKIIDFGEALGKTLGQYRARYFNAVPKRLNSRLTVVQYELRKGCDAMIQKAIAGRTRALNADGLIDVPPLIENDIFLDLDNSEQTIYDEFESEMFAELENRELITFTAGAKYNKCCQLANGAVYNEDKEVLFLHNKKIEALKILIDELDGKPLLVAYRFKHDLARIQKAIPSAMGYAPDIIDRWNKKRIPILCAQYQSMARGLNLQSGGRHLACFSLTDNFDDYYQMVRRLYRQGATSKTFVHRFIVNRTVDRAMLTRLNRRQNGMENLLAGLLAYQFLKTRGIGDSQRPRRPSKAPPEPTQ